MGKEARKLAGELKQFLQSQSEEDLLSAAGTLPAVAVNAAPVKKQGPTLVVQFKRDTQPPLPAEDQHPAPTAESVAKTAPFTPQDAQPAVSTLTTQEKTDALNALAEVIRNCRRCPLGDTRLNAVPGEGNVDAKLMFIGEGPGFDEDHNGRPFIGRAGQLLDKMILAMGLSREQVFIGNIAKCHPMIDPANPEKHGNDRPPQPPEIAACRRYIEQQISIVQPQYVVALGGVAAKALISDAKSLGALRGRFYDLQLDTVKLSKPVKIIATYHPAALIRNPAWKKDAWVDLQMVMSEMGLSRPQV